MSLVERVSEKVEKIHAGKQVHSLSNLKSVIKETWSICDEALTLCAWQPYASLAETMYTLIEQARDATKFDTSKTRVIRYEVPPIFPKFQFIVQQNTDIGSYLAKEFEQAKWHVDLFKKL